VNIGPPKDASTALFPFPTVLTLWVAVQPVQTSDANRMTTARVFQLMSV
jgi:hypothetical protein